MFQSEYLPAGNLLTGPMPGSKALAPRAARATFFRTLKEHMLVSPRLIALLDPAPLISRLGYYEVVDTKHDVSYYMCAHCDLRRLARTHAMLLKHFQTDCPSNLAPAWDTAQGPRTDAQDGGLNEEVRKKVLLYSPFLRSRQKTSECSCCSP
jgi:hypothetical protein